MGNLMAHTKASHPDAEERVTAHSLDRLPQCWTRPEKAVLDGAPIWQFKCTLCPITFYVPRVDGREWIDESPTRDLSWLWKHAKDEHATAVDVPSGGETQDETSASPATVVEPTAGMYAGKGQGPSVLS
ncbi:hypothetical protein EXIGLDRAFT_764071 [Exidia glandulosa HHB12029]|uniref:Uncharacterized protein n=1 Tax=Exidia glandulosa HHB12029 TaxID=1314781 RepID=A0A165LI27_EXIGL|nr:hypothetical protein EXIGLDRAFT_764071 [Exidia glandulosa HHB12029]